MIKGSNRRLFRRPGMARQAIGILASSPELAMATSMSPGQRPMPQPMQPRTTTVGMQPQQGMPMPMQAQAQPMMQQPVQNFARGGLAELLGYMPGYTQTGTEEAPMYEPTSGLLGAYQRMSGIEDPTRAREAGAFDLMRLGARIAGGESTSTTRNVAGALEETLGDVEKRRASELGFAAKKYELLTAAEERKAEDEYRKAQLANQAEQIRVAGESAAAEAQYREGQLGVAKDELAIKQIEAKFPDDTREALSRVGGSVITSGDNIGKVRYGGQTYDTLDDAYSKMSEDDKTIFQSTLQSRTGQLSDAKFFSNQLSDPNTSPELRLQAAVVLAGKLPEGSEGADQIMNQVLIYNEQYNANTISVKEQTQIGETVVEPGTTIKVIPYGDGTVMVKDAKTGQVISIKETM